MYLGVDAGGTKTAFVLVDRTGAVVGEAVGPSGYAFGVGLDGVRSVLVDGVRDVTDAAGVRPRDVERAFVALPGYGEDPVSDAALDALVREVFGGIPADVENDAVAGWAGSLGGEDGIDVVAGTGSIAYGELGGRRARAGGWSELFGDEGSGYWIAVEGLRAFSRMADGRAPAGPLLPIMRAATGARSDLGVIGVVMSHWGGDRTRIAALSRDVAVAAGAGDEVAGGILARAGAELAALVAAVRTGLGAEEGRVLTVSWSGGVFGAPAVLASFTDALGPDAVLQAPLFGPAQGAALAARRRAAASGGR